ncbi:MAG: hypothetical protein PHI45_02365 [Candidatus Pacebacteria bacterium]|nr:hypothetical protein [Candidatus Paceibacterota bacterium]MDD5013139.1 hypothetical protein [Candidatus Paceibacterota bacterium]MDD5752904.1 hypothetical protein [Candidatus Paceibacterota bacterium]
MIEKKKDGVFIDTDEEKEKESMRNKIKASHIAFEWEQTKQEIIEVD